MKVFYANLLKVTIIYLIITMIIFGIAVFKQTVCIGNESYSIPKYWVVEYQVENNNASFFGLEFFSYKNKDIDNTLFLRSSTSTASFRQNIPEIPEKNLQEAGFTHIKDDNCSYYLLNNSKHQYSHLIFRKKRIGVFIYDTNEDALKEITTMLCNPH